MIEPFVKRPREFRSAEAEAAGLRWLREASTAVVNVIDVNADANEMTIERVDTVRPTPDAAFSAGVELAHIHNAGAEAFGSPPPGWDGPNYIGRQEQECTPTEDWATFYAEQRVRPFARKAVRVGHLDQAGLTTVEKALDAVQGAGFSPDVARLHGDLWSGNLMFGRSGPVFIDPAAHGGHRETDLAMLALFGAPHLDQIRHGYESVHPLPSGWLELTEMHQLHPLAVHAASHGPSYGHALVDAARAALAIL